MHIEQTIVDASGVTVTDVSCRAEPYGWSAPEPVTGPTVVLIRSGLFQRRVGSRDAVLDSSMGYLPTPGTEASFAHPAGDDRCTSITVSEAELEALLGPANRPRLITTSPRLDLTHRVLVARARTGAPPDELAERAYVLLALTVGAAQPQLTAATSRRCVDQVRQQLAADRSASLDDLARTAGLSPYHLSRTFRQVTGMTITAYRIRLRLRDALDHLAAGQTDLAALAVETGFSDQAHLSRLLKRETGTTPARVRRLLSSPA